MREPWCTARLQPSQNTMALVFSPSESSHIAQVESSDGSARSGLGMFFVYKMLLGVGGHILYA